MLIHLHIHFTAVVIMYDVQVIKQTSILLYS